MEEVHKREFFEELADKLEDLFPKGKCNERGAALVLLAEASMLYHKYTFTHPKQSEEKECNHEYYQSSYNKKWVCVGCGMSSWDNPQEETVPEIPDFESMLKKLKGDHGHKTMAGILVELIHYLHYQAKKGK